MGHFRPLLVSALLGLLSGCGFETCPIYDCKYVDYLIRTENPAGSPLGVDTVSADSFAVQIVSGRSESGNAGSVAMGATGTSDCATCVQRTTLTHLTFSVDVVPPRRDTVKADSNYLAAPLRGADFYEFVFNRKHIFAGNQVRVTFRLLVDGSFARTGYKDFVIIP